MKRKIVKFDENKCTGCGECVDACAEAAIEIVNGKARMAGEVYCDGLGACLGRCPEDAIAIEEREAEAFDERAVTWRLRRLSQPEPAGCPSAAIHDHGAGPASAGCPSAVSRDMATPNDAPSRLSAGPDLVEYRLRNWPIQLALVQPDAPFLRGADLVLAADCTAFARPTMLTELTAGRPLLIACPKLDDSEPYLSKLTDMFAEAHLRSLTIVHMTVPCCHGLSHIVRQAMGAAGADVPVTEVTIGIEGNIETTKNWPAQARTAET
ncbi:MAG: 4Fe-4S binding protein [Verrucomicrobia bacterium]|nr:4Fe-4S binding protein [Verrucomicrobiota bacterium]